MEDRNKSVINNQKYLQGSGESGEQVVSLFIQSSSCTETWCTSSLPLSQELLESRAAVEEFTDHPRVGYCTSAAWLWCCGARDCPLSLLPLPRERVLEGKAQAVQVQS